MARSQRHRSSAQSEPDILDKAIRYLIIGGIGTLVVLIGFFIHRRYDLQVRPAQIEHAEKVEPGFLAHSMPLEAIMEVPTGEDNAARYYLEGSKPYDTRRASEEGYDAKDVNEIAYDSPVLDTFIAGAQHREARFSEFYSLYQVPDQAMPPFFPFQVIMSNLAEKVEAHYARSFQEVTTVEKDAEVAKALEAAKAIVVFGRHLTQERLSVRQFLIGMEAQILGAKKLRKVYHRMGEKELVDKVARYESEAHRLLDAAEEKLGLIRPLDEDYSDAAIRIALEDEDPAFRALATIILEDSLSGFLYPQTKRRIRAALEQVEEREQRL